MSKVARTIEIEGELDAALERLATSTQRSPSDVVSEAIEYLLSAEEDVLIDLQRLAKFERTGEAIDADEMRHRLDEMMAGRRQPAK